MVNWHIHFRHSGAADALGGKDIGKSECKNLKKLNYLQKEQIFWQVAVFRIKKPCQASELLIFGGATLKCGKGHELDTPVHPTLATFPQPRRQAHRLPQQVLSSDSSSGVE
jgi:hypothetical protein